MNPVLVTGGAGYIGSHTSLALSADGWMPVAFDNLSRGHADLAQWGPLVVGDILDPTALDDAIKRHRPQAVVHFAALAYVGESFSDPLAYYKVNVSGMVNVLGAMIRHGIDTIVFSSSCSTYGIPESVPIAEDAPQMPISPYGWSKLMCERILKDCASRHALRFAVLRYFNAAGAEPGGRLAERHHPETHLIPLAIDAALGKAPPLRIFGSDYPTADGTCERDYIHVSDLAAAHVLALRALKANERSLELNLGSGRAHSVRQVVSAVEGIVGAAVPMQWAPRRPGDAPTLYSDNSRARSALGFAPNYSDLHTIVETAWRARL